MKLFFLFIEKQSVLHSETCFATFLFMLFSVRGEARRAA